MGVRYKNVVKWHGSTGQPEIQQVRNTCRVGSYFI